MTNNQKTRQRIFILDSDESYKLAEEFKIELENEGYKVTSTPYGFSDLHIIGVR